jgi:TPR repeat protein
MVIRRLHFRIDPQSRLRAATISSGLAFFMVVSICSAQPPRVSLRERASKGDPEAQFNLGKNYEGGRGGLKKDYTEAERWYRRSAEQGDPFAQASLGLLFRFGKGVSQDYIEAYKWFYLAASRTTGSDRDSIVELRDSTARHLTAEQLAAAEQWARDWKPKPKSP